VDSPVRLCKWFCVGPYEESIPAVVHLEDNGRDHATCRPGSYPPLETPLAPDGKLTNAVTETSNLPGNGPSCSFTPSARSPNPVPIALPFRLLIITRRTETQFCPREDSKAH
jgi:hypothetical protein